MKVIITEDQYYNIMLKRRFNDIMDEAFMIVNNGDNFYGDIDFCFEFPTFYSFMEDVVTEVIRQYNYISNFEPSEFIHETIGTDNFIDMILDRYNDEFKSFYKKRTKNCK